MEYFKLLQQMKKNDDNIKVNTNLKVLNNFLEILKLYNVRIDDKFNEAGWQKLASFRQAQKMPSILSSDAYARIC